MLDGNNISLMMRDVPIKVEKVKCTGPGVQRPSLSALTSFTAMLTKYGPLSRKEIQALMGITKSFAFNCANFLEADGKIIRYLDKNKGKRKSIIFELVEK